MINRSVLSVGPCHQITPCIPLSVNQVIAITEDGPEQGIAAALLLRLQKKGFLHTKVVTTVPPETDVLIVLNGLSPSKTIEEAIACQRTVFQYARTVANRFTQKGGVWITLNAASGLFGVNKIEPIRVWASGLSGLTKTAAQEWPKAFCQAIDIELGKQSQWQIADRIVDHLFSGVIDRECYLPLKGGAETIAVNTQAIQTECTFPLSTNDVVVVSGGARGITSHCLLALAKTCSLRFVLLGRTVLSEEPEYIKDAHTEIEIKQRLINYFKKNQQPTHPADIQKQTEVILANREIKSAIAALIAAGSEVMYRSVDVLDAAQLSSALSDVRKQWGPIKGLIHAAGVLSDKLISQKTDEQFDRVFHIKVMGLKNLLDVTQKDPLSLLLFFSSVAARYGNPGQCDYAMANETLNKIAYVEKNRRGMSCLVKSYNWGPWEGGMVTPDLKKSFLERGIQLLSIENGTSLFVNELRDNEVVEVVLGGKIQHDIKPHRYSVNAITYPILLSHVIGDTPVIPACLVLEWFLRFAKAAAPELNISALCDFKVLKGIRLNHYHDSGDALLVVGSLKQTPHGTSVQTTLTNDVGALFYSAEITLSTSVPAPENMKEPWIENSSWPWDVSDIYEPCYHPTGHRLFHGKDLQPIKALTTFSKQGATAELLTLQGRLNDIGPWVSDLFVLDGVLQLLQLWNYDQLRYHTLPTAIREFKLYDASLALKHPQLHCLIKGSAQGKYRTITDAWVYDAHGTCYASLHGIEMCAIQTTSEKHHAI